ncbi:MAG: hypothetical protein ACO38K_04935, partial [Ilumatobacteraceae bacterium]
KGGLQVPALAGPRAQELLTHLHPGSSVSNPIDFLATGTAEQLGVSVGDRLEVRVGSQPHPLTLIALLNPENEFNRQALRNLLLMSLRSVTSRPSSVRCRIRAQRTIRTMPIRLMLISVITN